MVACAYIGVGFALLAHNGVSFTGLITTSAILTAVIGFSLQDTLGNIMGGLALQMEKTINVGDWVRVDQQVGRVKEIRWRHTALETRNWDTLVIPNSILMKGQVLVLGRRTGQPVLHRQWVYFNVDFRIAPTEVISAVNDALQAEPIPGWPRSRARMVFCLISKRATASMRYGTGSPTWRRMIPPIR